MPLQDIRAQHEAWIESTKATADHLHHQIQELLEIIAKQEAIIAHQSALMGPKKAKVRKVQVKTTVVEEASHE